MTASPDIHAEVPAATVPVEPGVIIRALEDTVARQAVQIAKQEALLRSYDQALEESRGSYRLPDNLNQAIGLLSTHPDLAAVESPALLDAVCNLLTPKAKE